MLRGRSQADRGGTPAVAIPDNSTSTGYTTEDVRIESTDLLTFGQHPTLANVSGTAIFSTTFDLPAKTHALVDLGTCSHTCKITVNGKAGPHVDILNAVVDVSDMLAGGFNSLDVEISTPLGNFLR